LKSLFFFVVMKVAVFVLLALVATALANPLREGVDIKPGKK